MSEKHCAVCETTFQADNRARYCSDTCRAKAQRNPRFRLSRKPQHYATTEQNMKLRAFISEELVALWDDLYNAQGRAQNGEWSIECDNLGERIVTASNLVGPVDWNEVGLPLVTSGWLEDMSRRIGVQHPKLPTGAQMAELFNKFPEHAHTRDDVLTALHVGLR